MNAIPFSVLDLSPVPMGASVADALHNSADLARHAEGLGYRRYWLAEHHSMPGIASAATSVVIGHVAAATRHIRVGAGGIMLPNHSPLQVAEQFGTLEALFPGRIDLGLGRAPGTDGATSAALRRTLAGSADHFPADVVELLNYFGPADALARVRAVPGEGMEIPVWILGSSLFGAELAAELGLPYAFASHFAPDYVVEALELYRSRFRPSDRLAKPYAMVGLNVYAADDDATGRLLFTSIQQQFLALRRGNPGLLPPPDGEIEARMSPQEAAGVRRALAFSAIGGPEAVRDRIAALLALAKPDEVMVAAQIYDHAARKRSYSILADVLRDSGLGTLGA
ncbi:LLM class flavin-dependent oxidoreductase [Niveispirillum irakense]|uniref:LLM class flavin-dependent oxidoreductase n=1 Tax=Niveispirillum irakense TaxID=34011 RepID=UPI000424B205|nr:LLM class flavin-dependent oxidoreductase [Niveispirillum irakense]